MTAKRAESHGAPGVPYLQPSEDGRDVVLKADEAAKELVGEPRGRVEVEGGAFGWGVGLDNAAVLVVRIARCAAGVAVVDGVVDGVAHETLHVVGVVGEELGRKGPGGLAASKAIVGLGPSRCNGVTRPTDG